MKKFLISSIILVSTFHVFADTVTVGQKNKTFTVAGNTASELTVNKGDVVRFENNDDIFHNVFSLSDAKLFDLGSFPKGEHRDVVLDTSGVVEVECAIHPEMKITITVE